jgi:methanogenic corrinoid protein MtbC1
MQILYDVAMDRSLARPDLLRYSDEPRYTMQAVERATGLSPRTLRSWERRYGTPSPVRDAGSRRLYSERDIALIRWLTERIGQGFSIGRAIRLLSERERVGEYGPADRERWKLQLLQAIDWMDEEKVASILAQAMESMPFETVVLELIQPVLYRIGDLWAAGRMSVASEHFGTEMLRSALGDLLTRSPQPWRPHHVLVGCAPGEMHTIGALALALFLRNAGYRVTYLGANVEGESLKADLQRLQPAALCLSATTRAARDAVAELYRATRTAFHGILAFGGSAFADDARDLRDVPGVNLGHDVQRAPRVLEAALGGDESVA